MEVNIEDNHIGYLIRQVSLLSQQLYNDKLDREGVTFSQDSVLSILYKNNGATQSDLRTSLFIKPSSVTNLINTLERKNLVKRIMSNKDGRVKKIVLTEEGLLLEERLLTIKKDVEFKLTRFLSKGEVSLLSNHLKQVKKSLLEDDD